MGSNFKKGGGDAKGSTNEKKAMFTCRMPEQGRGYDRLLSRMFCPGHRQLVLVLDPRVGLLVDHLNTNKID